MDTVTQSTEALYQAREKRFYDAISLKRPDRVPIASHSAYFFYPFAGYSFKDVMYDYDKQAEAIKISTKHFQWDMAPSVPAGSGPLMELFGLTQYRWAGFNLPDNHMFQFIEGEYMISDEYDELLKNPEGFTLRRILPRISEQLAPLAELPSLLLMSGGQSLITQLGGFITRPEVTEAIHALLRAGEEMVRYNKSRAKMAADLKAAGFPLMAGSHCNAPFDWIGNYLRGMRGVMLDMYRNPDKLLATIDLFTPVLIENAVQAAKRTGIPRVFFPLHRGAGGFMSNDQFAKFYWPSLKHIFLALIDAGLTPMPFFEGDYTDRLEFLAELPEGKILGHFQNMDLDKYRKMLEDVMCFRGNVPADLLVAGSPEKVKDYVKKLIDTLSDRGGLIIDGGSGIPYESKTENVEAMVEAVHESGKY